MGAKPSTTAQPTSPGGREGLYSSDHEGAGASGHYGSSSPGTSGLRATQSSSERTRARSLSYMPNSGADAGPSGFGFGFSSFLRGRSIDSGSPPSGLNSMESLESGGLGRFLGAHSLPGNLWSLSPNGIKCPVCNKFVLPDDVECHIVMCLTKPRINYNEDVLTEDKDECVICLEDLQQGQVIARLPCLCVYHKRCIDEWFQVSRTCPEHPGD